jgi:hypothetical protein
MLPIYVAQGGVQHLWETAAALSWQVIGQGLIGGGVIVIAYCRAVVLLGPSKAGSFPRFFQASPF